MLRFSKFYDKFGHFFIIGFTVLLYFLSLLDSIESDETSFELVSRPKKFFEIAEIGFLFAHPLCQKSFLKSLNWFWVVVKLIN
jgi:hypothetical protein